MKRLFTLLCMLLAPLTAMAEQAKHHSVLTGLPVNYMLASQLLEGTDAEVKYLPPSRYGMHRMANWLDGQGQQTVQSAASEADAVITLAAAWPQDPLFRYARAHNIRLVEIDASQTIGPRAQSVAVLPGNNGQPSPYVWLNPANLAQMNTIVAMDLQRLWPQHQATIRANRAKLNQAILSMQQRQAMQLMEAEIDSVILLDEPMEDFAAGHQLFVHHRQFGSELEWSDAQSQALVQALEDDPEAVILMTRRASGKLNGLLPEGTRVLQIDALDRWGRGIDNADPLARWALPL
ncbi:metal ABC transporter solute-binding protein, Zn/Mn family [Ferrimonas marina]|uniref:ABC-type Zn uptake system ZnuABC, Zn-binding component ZnuA n=1 Tax=Ferrimonas marina TaxID=299255 RepID=A0A1M5VCP8_9GAMM|nr:zinc ABC transporter substrate-binding protein [Ferrimonas marina]SHH72884.1 ABC-type Zn uptake system ZnuABC, Zn-binding component ZnuA [Ferrimonas marina]